MTSTDRLAALIAAAYNDWEESTDTDVTMEGFLAARLITAGVTLDPPVRGDLACDLCGRPWTADQTGHYHSTTALAQAIAKAAQRLDGLTDEEMAGVVAVNLPSGTPEEIAALIAADLAGVTLDPRPAPVRDPGPPRGPDTTLDPRNPTRPAPDAALREGLLTGLREAYLAGVRRGASDGMEAYPEVADDYLDALRAALEDER